MHAHMYVHMCFISLYVYVCGGAGFYVWNRGTFQLKDFGNFDG